MADERTERERRMMDEESLDEAAEKYFERGRGMLPPDFRTHFRAARKEFLLAARSLLDAQIERLEQKERQGARNKPTRVRID